jgi:hypothetical protein
MVSQVNVDPHRPQNPRVVLPGAIIHSVARSRSGRCGSACNFECAALVPPIPYIVQRIHVHAREPGLLDGSLIGYGEIPSGGRGVAKTRGDFLAEPSS